MTINQNGGGEGQGLEKVIIVPLECERGKLQERKMLKQDHIIVMFFGNNSRKETAEPGVQLTSKGFRSRYQHSTSLHPCNPLLNSEIARS